MGARDSPFAARDGNAQDARSNLGVDIAAMGTGMALTATAASDKARGALAPSGGMPIRFRPLAPHSPSQSLGAHPYT